MQHTLCDTVDLYFARSHVSCSISMLYLELYSIIENQDAKA